MTKRFHIHWHRRTDLVVGTLFPTPVYICRCGSRKYGVMYP